MAEKYISQVAVQGQAYKIKDAELRTDVGALSVQVGTNTTNIAENAVKIAALEEIVKGGVHYRGKSLTVLTDGSQTNPINIEDKDGQAVEYTAEAGDIVVYGSKEFVFDGAKWNEFGDITGLKALAFKDSASGSYTPAGNVTVADKVAVDLTCTTGFTGTAFEVLDGVTCKETSTTASFSGTQLTGVGATVTLNETTTTA